MTVVRKCDSPQNVCWWGGVMVMGEVKWLEEVYHLTGNVSHQGGVK